MPSIEIGQRVTFYHSVFLENGACLDSPNKTAPLTLKAGYAVKDPIANSISQALIGMSTIGRKRILISPESAYGNVDKNLIYKLKIKDQSNFVEGEKIKLKIQDQQGERVVDGFIDSLHENFAIVSLNHPLAGKTLTVDLKIISIN